MSTDKSRGVFRPISFLTATCVVVANMVGTGIFTSLGFQVGDLPSGFVILVLWLVGGICALCGALAYGELAAALPRSGGEYHFLSVIYHPAVGFLSGWLSATVGFAAPIALAAMAFGKYFASVFPSLPSLVIFPQFAVPPDLLVSLAIVALVMMVHLWSVEFGGKFQAVSTVFKIVLIVGLVIAGVFATDAQPVSFLPRAGDAALIVGGPFAVSLVYVMYAYSGWNASTYIVGEVRDPGRNVPRSVAIGTLLVIVLYMALNAIFLHTAPMSELAGKVDVGHVAAARIFGPEGGRIMAGLICAGLVSSISAMTWVGPRVTMAMGEDSPPLRFLARRTPQGVPRVAILIQTAIVAILLLTASFPAILTYIQFSLTFCSFLTVLGVYVLRFRRPDLARPYRTWGYPVTPLIFLAVSLWMMLHIVRANPKESLAGLATMLLGLAVYFLSPTKVQTNPS